MSTARLASTRPIVAAFTIWFAHFMACWVAVEIWPGQWLAHVLAWGFTAVALLALGLYALRLKRSAPQGELTGWTRRFGQGAAAIAALAVVFTAIPSISLLP
jgi:hypothetical protein